MSARSFDINVTKKQANISVVREGSNWISVSLHGHCVLTYQKDIETIVISSCGYRTNTTKTAINRALSQLNLSNRITQKKGAWYLDTTLFYDGIKLDSFGNIIHVPDTKKPVLTLVGPWQK